MNSRLQRAAWTAAPVLFGMMIGIAWSEIEMTPDAAAADQGRAKAKAASKTAEPVRMGAVVRVNRETVDQYVLLHKHVWPKVLQRIRDSNIRNYSIYMGEMDDGNLYLFSYLEYVGDDMEGDMAAVANDPVTREWWKMTDPLQTRLKNTPTGSQWKSLTEVFHTD